MIVFHKTGIQRQVIHSFMHPVKGKSWWRKCKIDSEAGVKKKKRKKERDPVPLGRWWDIFTLAFIYKVGESAPPGWHKQKCLCDGPEKTSSIRLYIVVSQLFTQTLRSVKTGPQSADHHTPMETHNSHTYSETTGPRTLSDVCVCMCFIAVWAFPFRDCVVPSFSLTALVFVHTCLVSYECPSLSFPLTQANWPMRSQSK